MKTGAAGPASSQHSNFHSWCSQEGFVAIAHYRSPLGSTKAPFLFALFPSPPHTLHHILGPPFKAATKTSFYTWKPSVRAHLKTSFHYCLLIPGGKETLCSTTECELSHLSRLPRCNIKLQWVCVCVCVFYCERAVEVLRRLHGAFVEVVQFPWKVLPNR